MKEMKTRKMYEKPSMRVFELRQKPALLVGSGLGNPNDYPGSGDPYNF